MSYITAKNIQDLAEAAEADDLQVFKNLAESAPAIFDLACEVPNNFFAKAETTAKEQTFFADGTKFVKISPYLADSIEQVLIDEVEQVSDNYIEKDNYLIFNSAIFHNSKIKVTAKFGFEKVPSDVVQACIELALLIWRRKDLNFATISEVDISALLEELSPTASLVCRKYRERYSQFSSFG